MGNTVEIRYCSFCGHSEHGVDLLIVAWNGNSPGICNNCIDMCNDIIASREEAAITVPTVDRSE